MDPSNFLSEIEICSVTQESATEVGHQSRLASEINVPFSSGDQKQEAATANEVRLSGMDLAVYKAAQQGHVDVLREHRELLGQILTPTKNTVLHIYLAYPSTPKLNDSREVAPRSIDIVKEILEMCPPILMKQNESFETALHTAARHGHAGIVTALIDAAKALRGDLEQGWASTEEGCLQSQRLIRKTNKDKDTALHEAVRFNRLGVVEILTREDAEFSYSANDAGETPVYLAAERGYLDVVSVILDTCTYPSYQGPNGRTALHAAVIYNEEEIMRKLLEKDRALATEIDERGCTPLHLAASFGHASIVKQLLEYDRSAAYVADKDDKMTALHFAASKGHLDVIKELLSHCPDCCELVDVRRRNVLHHALEKHQLEISKFLQQEPWLSNFLINGKDVDGNTPIHQIAGSFIECANLLFDHRVDKMIFNKQNRNALDVYLANETTPQLEALVTESFEKMGARPGHRIVVSDKDGGRKLKGNKDGYNKPKETKEAHLVVAILIATVTFAAGFTMPGGYENEKEPNQGFAVLTRYAAFKAFVVSDTLAMAMSSCSVLMHLYLSTEPNKYLRSDVYELILSYTMWALIAMGVAFITGTYAALGHSSGLAIAACVLGCFFFFFMSYSIASAQSMASTAENLLGKIFFNILSLMHETVTFGYRSVKEMARFLLSFGHQTVNQKLKPLQEEDKM